MQINRECKVCGHYVLKARGLCKNCYDIARYWRAHKKTDEEMVEFVRNRRKKKNMKVVERTSIPDFDLRVNENYDYIGNSNKTVGIWLLEVIRLSIRRGIHVYSKTVRYIGKKLR